MTNISWVAKTLPLVIGIGLFVSACTSDSNYDPGSYTPPDPVYGVPSGSGWSGWHSGWTRDHDYIGN